MVAKSEEEMVPVGPDETLGGAAHVDMREFAETGDGVAPWPVLLAAAQLLAKEDTVITLHDADPECPSERGRCLPYCARRPGGCFPSSVNPGARSACGMHASMPKHGRSMSAADTTRGRHGPSPRLHLRPRRVAIAEQQRRIPAMERRAPLHSAAGAPRFRGGGAGLGR